jgi:hypothetical protein
VPMRWVVKPGKSGDSLIAGMTASGPVCDGEPS